VKTLVASNEHQENHKIMFPFNLSLEVAAGIVRLSRKMAVQYVGENTVSHVTLLFIFD
jgi:hypothetical protein